MGKRVFLLTLCFFMLISCTPNDYTQTKEENNRWIDVYYVAGKNAGNDELAIASEPRQIPYERRGEMIRSIVEQLQQKPVRQTLRSPFSKDVTVQNVDIKNGEVILNLSKEYQNMSNIWRTVADYCIVLSLSELKGVDSVTILVEGVPPIGRPTSKMKREDVVLSDIKLIQFQQSIQLYFANEDNTELVMEERSTISREHEPVEKIVLQGLMDGPRGKNLYSVIPKGTQVLSVYTDARTCYVNLSRNFIRNHKVEEQAEKMTLQALIQSLVALKHADRIQILIEGQKVKGFTYYDLSIPYSLGDIY